MNDKNYYPEGILIKTSRNREAMASLAALEEARASSKILEARVNLCSSAFELSLDLGVCRGIIPRSEVAGAKMERRHGILR